MGTGPNAQNIEGSLDESFPSGGYYEDIPLIANAGMPTESSVLDASIKCHALTSAVTYSFTCPGHIAPNTTVRLVLVLALGDLAGGELEALGKVVRLDGTSSSLAVKSKDVALVSSPEEATHKAVAFSWDAKYSAGDSISFSVSLSSASGDCLLAAAMLRAKRHASLANRRARTFTTETF